MKTAYIKQRISTLLQLTGFSYLTYTLHVQGFTHHSGAWTGITAVFCKTGELYHRVFAFREAGLFKKPNGYTRQLKYVLYSYTCICIPLDFRFIFFHKKDSFTQWTVQYHQKKRITHFLFSWRSAAVKFEPSTIPFHSLKNNNEKSSRSRRWRRCLQGNVFNWIFLKAFQNGRIRKG